MKLGIFLVIISTIFCGTALADWQRLYGSFEYDDIPAFEYPFVVTTMRDGKRQFGLGIDCAQRTTDLKKQGLKAADEKRLSEMMVEKYCRFGNEALPKDFYQLTYTGKDFLKFAAWLDTRSYRLDQFGNTHFSWRLIPRYPVPYAFEHDQLDSAAKREAFSYAIVRTTVNCAEKFLRGNSVEFYNTSGSMIEEKTNSDAGKYVDAGTFGGDLVAEVCKE